MAEDHLQSLRRLMKRYRIRFQLLGEEWTALHADTFSNIKALGSSSFDTYSVGVSIWSSNEPWKQQIKDRAEWLNQRAQRLFSQEHNESASSTVRYFLCVGIYLTGFQCPQARY